MQLKFKYLLPVEKPYSINIGWSFVFPENSGVCGQTFSHSVINTFIIFQLAGHFQLREVDTQTPCRFVDCSQLKTDTLINATTELMCETDF